MKVFFCHQSTDKPLIREIRSGFPESVRPWIDEQSILWGNPLAQQLQTAIQSDTFFLIIFLSEHALHSQWVQQELEWALERERELGRTFVLPIFTDQADSNSWPDVLRLRNFLVLKSKDSHDVMTLSRQVVEKLFHLTVDLLDRDALFLPRTTVENTLARTLRSVHGSLSTAIRAHPDGSPQQRFVRRYLESVTKDLTIKSDRLRDGEYICDYNDTSHLTSFVSQLVQGEGLLGLTDWEVDHQWWSGQDAQEFLDANRQAIERGARIERLFVHSLGTLVNAQGELFRKAINQHSRMGVHAYVIRKHDLPSHCNTLQSQCVLYRSTPAEKEAWLTYHVQFDAKGYPLRNIFSLRSTVIKDNLAMLESILSKAIPWTPADCGGEACDPSDTARRSENYNGRRIYIHQESFEHLASTDISSAAAIYSFLIAIPVIKLAFHDLQEEAVYTGRLSLSVANRLVKVISDRWYTAATSTLRQIYYRPTRNGQVDGIPLLQNAETVVATCFDAGYYTFATSNDAARRMYADLEPIADVWRHVRESDPKVKDLTMLKGHCLTFNNGGPFPSSTNRGKRVSSRELNVVKGNVRSTFEEDLRGIIKRAMRDCLDEERKVGESFTKKCIETVGRFVAVLNECDTEDKQPQIT